MNHDERINELRYYESEWLKENALHLEEQNKRFQLESEVAALKLENQKLRTLASQVEQVPVLKQERDALQTALESLKQSLVELDTLASLKHDLEWTKQELASIQRRVSRENFWRNIAQEFAEEIEDFPAIYGGETQESDKAILETLEKWHLEIEVSVSDVLDGQATFKQISKIRQILIAQWVLLRWFEVTGAIK